MIPEIIKERLKLTGTMTQASFASEVGVSAGQASLFFNGLASLTGEQYEKAFELVDIRLDTYKKRLELATAVAKELANQNITIEDIQKMSKTDMAKMSMRDEVLYFIETATKKEFDSYIASDLIEPECLFPVFKSLVMLSAETQNINLTPKNVSKSYDRIVKKTKMTNMYSGVALAGLASTAILLFAAGGILKKGGGLATLIGMGRNLLKDK